jgi:hypothetical protein
LAASAITVGAAIPHPRLIDLPEEVANFQEEIVDVACGTRHSIIFTKSG